MLKLLPTLLISSLLESAVLAHPGSNHDHDEHALIQRRNFLSHARSTFANSCSSTSAQKRALAYQTALQRQQNIERLRAEKRAEKAKRSLNAQPKSAKFLRQAPGSAEPSEFTEEVLATSHKSNLTGITSDTTTSALFDTSNSTCLLQPEATIGPYWVASEYVRDDVSEDQPGVPLYMSAQFLDINSCEPVPEMYWEVWHCNSTGVYSARATHVHIIGHTNATFLANNTIGTGTGENSTSTAVHIGQLSFNQDLLTEVFTTSPYSTNTQEVTANADDSIFAGETTVGSPDPIFEYVLLGDDVSDGIFAWISIGVVTTASQTTQAASTLTDEGGVANESSMSGGPGRSGGPPSSRNSTSTATEEDATSSTSANTSA